MKLYYFPECPFCQKVLRTIAELGVEEKVELVTAYPGTEGGKELVKIGGKQQVPFLVDGEMKLYESKDICEYLVKKFSP